MGGMQTRMIALAHLDAFSHIGIFSGGNLGELTATNSPLANPADFNRQVKVAFVSYGSVEGGANSLKSYHDALVAAGITNMSYYISPGTAHEWQTLAAKFLSVRAAAVPNSLRRSTVARNAYCLEKLKCMIERMNSQNCHRAFNRSAAPATRRFSGPPSRKLIPRQWPRQGRFSALVAAISLMTLGNLAFSLSEALAADESCAASNTSSKVLEEKFERIAKTLTRWT